MRESEVVTDEDMESMETILSDGTSNDRVGSIQTSANTLSNKSRSSSTQKLRLGSRPVNRKKKPSSKSNSTRN